MNKRKILLIFTGLILLLLLLIAFVLFITGKARKVPEDKKLSKPTILSEPTFDSKSAVSNIKLTASLPEVRKMPVYSVKNILGSRLTSAYGRLELAQLFGFSNEPFTTTDAVRKENLYIWSAKGFKLTLYGNAGYLLFNRDVANFSVPQTGSLPTVEEAEIQVNSLVDKLETQQQSVDYGISGVTYRKIGAARADEALVKSEADILEVRFDAKVGDYNIVNESGAGAAVVAWFLRNGDLAKFIYRPTGSLESLGSYELKDLEAVSENINAGEVNIVDLGRGDYTEDLNKDIYSIVITAVDLAYLQPTTEYPYLQPIYVFTGTAEFADGVKTPITLYLSAVAEKYID